MKKENIILSILLILFSIITILVLTNKTKDIDMYVYNLLHSFSSDKLTSFFKGITSLGNSKFCVILVLGFLLLLRNLKGLFPLLAAIDVEIINLVLKFIFKRPRPNIIHLVHVSNYSYPSGHAMISVGIYGCFIYMIMKYIKNKKLKILSVSLLSILILLIGMSRIYLGVHYFTDIVAGYIISCCYLIIFAKVVRKWGNIDETVNSK